MKLSDVVSGAHLAFFAEVALVLFLIAFVAIVLDAILFGKQQYQASLPLEEDSATRKARSVSGSDHGR